MNDMSKGIEGGSRAWELYTGAMDAAGTASQKFTVWQESIAASQNNMKNSLEQLYSNLQPSLIKGYYDVVTSIVNGLNNLGGTIPIIVALTAAIAGYVLVVNNASVATGILGTAMTALSKHPIMAIASFAVLAGSAIGLFGNLFNGVESASEKYENAVKKIEESNKKITSLQTAKEGISAMLEKVQSGAELTTEEISKYTSALNTIANTSPTAEQAVRNLNSGFGDQASILQQLSDKAQEAIDKELALQKITAETALMNFSNSEEYLNAGQYNRSYFDEASKRLPVSADIRALWSAIEVVPQLEDYINGQISSGMYDKYNREEIEAAIENFFSSYEAIVIQAAQNQAQNVISNVISALGQDVNLAQREYLGEFLLKYLMGDDGQLDYEDVAASRIKLIWDNLVQAAKDALQDSEEELRSLYQTIYDQFDLDLDQFDWKIPTPDTDPMGNTLYKIEKLNTEATELIYS